MSDEASASVDRNHHYASTFDHLRATGAWTAAAQKYRRNAVCCRDLAETAMTQEAKHVLLQMASDYEGKAVQAEELGAGAGQPAF
jgi:hypothetical protein